MERCERRAAISRIRVVGGNPVRTSVPSIKGVNKVNLTARRITAKAGLLAALAVAVAALATPVQPLRIYSIGAGGAAAEADLMPSDPPVIRD